VRRALIIDLTNPRSLKMAIVYALVREDVPVLPGFGGRLGTCARRRARFAWFRWSFGDLCAKTCPFCLVSVVVLRLVRGDVPVY
jgi:hypothetical protein